MSMLKQQPAPVQLPGQCAGGDREPSRLTGLYLLTNEGVLCRFDAAGDPLPDEALTRELGFRLQAVLHQYRVGAVEGLALGLIVETEPDESWNTDTLIVRHREAGDRLAGGGEPDAAATEQGKQYRATTVYQGMGLLLGPDREYRPGARLCCPVLFQSEVDRGMLCERYGIELALNRGVYEVLDLAAPFSGNNRAPRGLITMVGRMRRALSDGDSCLVQSAAGAPAAAPDPPEAAPLAGVGMDLVPEPLHDACFNEGDAATGWLLEWFSPFNELTDTQRDIIAGYETIRKASGGTRLIEQGSRDDTCIYLVEGSLALTGPDGGTMIVRAGTRRSRLPISVLSPHVYDVTAVTDVSVIAFSQKLVRRIIEISTTYTSVDPRQGGNASTTAISNGAQALYLNRSYHLASK